MRNNVPVALLCVVLLSCGSPRDRARLVGEYQADYPVATEDLSLAPDGSFRQVVTLKGTARRDTTHGRWTYDSRTGDVTFHDAFMIVVNGFGELNPSYVHPRPGLVTKPVSTFLGGVTLGSSEGIMYHKR